jgi:peptidoglycan hydrolase-like protein with peptidoglycan-binding domain
MITKKLTNVFAGVVVALVAFSMMASTASAAFTAEQNAAMVAAGFNATQIAAMEAIFGGSSTSSSTTSASSCATYGLPGVAGVQQAVNALGYMPALVVDGVAGPATKAGVMYAQAKVGAGVDGAWGPMTQAAYVAYVAANCTTTTTTTTETTTTTSFSGDEEGSLSDEGQLSQYANEEVGEGEDEVTVLGWEFEADGADQMIERVTIIIDAPTDPTEDDLEDFVTEVAVALDGDVLASMDVEDASYDRAADEYTFRFVGLDGVIEDGETGELTVHVSGTNNVSSDIDGQGWTVTLDSVRATSPNGVTETYDPFGGEDFTLESFSSANNVELKVDDTNDSPEQRSVAGDDNDEFDVDLLEFDLEAEGSDITIYNLTIDLVGTFADVTTAEEDAVNKLMLECGSNDYVESVNSASVTFDLGSNGMTIDEGDNVVCVVTAEMIELSLTDTAAAGELVLGDDLTADVDVATIDAEDESGDALTNVTGTANGEVQTFALGVAELSNISWTLSSAGTILDFMFTLEAGDEDIDVEIADLVETVNDNLSGGASVATSTITAVSGEYSGIVDDYVVDAGDTARFRVRYATASATSANNGEYFDVTISSVAGQPVPDDKEVSPTAVINLN